MNSATIELVKNELVALVVGKRFAKAFQLSRNEIAVDLRLSDSRYLYINFGPAEPRIYLISRRLRDLEKATGNPSPFALSLRKRVSGGEITDVRRRPDDRVLVFSITAEDELGVVADYIFVAQLTGRSSNLFLLNSDFVIADRARDTAGEGQQIGEIYLPPTRADSSPRQDRETPADKAATANRSEPSKALDDFYSEQATERDFTAAASAAIGKVSAEIKKREKLIGRLQNDLSAHGNADEWKHFGDLLLANVSTAQREGNTIIVTDYFDEAAPEIAIEAEENLSISEAAEKYYRRYTKARNAASEIAARIETVSTELKALSATKNDIESAIEERDLATLEAAVSGKAKAPTTPNRKTPATNSAARSFVSSDGFEILVGKKAKDNDVLTFKLAKSLDTWMHAADYPGSHVVVRNPNRKEIPQKTLIEAAQLAAFYSQGKTQVKAAVHYTLKKFVNKPKGAAPGLVSLASFKTLLVVPEFPAALDEKTK